MRNINICSLWLFMGNTIIDLAKTSCTLPLTGSTAIGRCLQMAAGLLRTVIQPGLTTEFPVSSELSTKPRIGHHTTTCEYQCTSNTCLTHIPSIQWPASTWPIACRHWSCCSKSCPFMNIPWIPTEMFHAWQPDYSRNHTNDISCACSVHKWPFKSRPRLSATNWP